MYLYIINFLNPLWLFVGVVGTVGGQCLGIGPVSPCSNLRLQGVEYQTKLKMMGMGISGVYLTIYWSLGIFPGFPSKILMTESLFQGI